VLDIHVQELIGAVVAIDIAQNELINDTVTIYNDNPSAAATLICKAPKLHRCDLQCLTRELAKITLKNNIQFWGVKILGKHNDHADALSRFKPYNWQALGYTMINATPIVQKYLDKLANYYPNLDPKIWKWSQEQIDILKIKIAEKHCDPKQPTSHLVKPKPKHKISARNILTRVDFDWLEKIVI
jgi:hypothetical protein